MHIKRPKSDSLLGEYLSTLVDADRVQVLNDIDASRNFVANLPPFQQTTVVKRSLSGSHVDSIRAEPLFQQSFGQRPHQFAYVDLTQLIALQPWIEPRSLSDLTCNPLIYKDT